MLTDELLTYILGGQPNLLAEPLATWLAASRPFATFVNTFHKKIRKKVRTAQDREGLLDLKLELETAYLLLQEKRLSVVYEPQPEQVRGPDFAVTYTTSHTFMVEVKRLRVEQEVVSSTEDTNNIIDERLADAVCVKLAQLLPQHSNVVLIGVEALHLTAADLRSTMLHMQQRVEHNDLAFLQRHRFRDRSDFFKQYQRLSELLVRETDGSTAVAWANPQAKHPLPSKARTALYRSHNI